MQEPAELAASTGYLLARVGAESRRLWARMLAEHGLTPHHFGVLLVLDLLQQRSLVERRPDPADRRRHAVALTPTGQAAIEELRRAGEQVEQRLLDCLTAAERTGLHRMLRKLLTALDS